MARKSKSDESNQLKKLEDAKLKELQTRFKELETKKTQVATLKEATEKRVNELKEEARNSFGSDNIDELKEKLKEMQAENEKRKKEYEEHLLGIETSLKEIDKEYARLSADTAEEEDSRGDWTDYAEGEDSRGKE